MMLCPPQNVVMGSKLSASHMERTVKLLRSRLQSRLALHKQFISLGECGQTPGYHRNPGSLMAPPLVFSVGTSPSEIPSECLKENFMF